MARGERRRFGGRQLRFAEKNERRIYTYTGVVCVEKSDKKAKEGMDVYVFHLVRSSGLLTGRAPTTADDDGYDGERNAAPPKAHAGPQWGRQRTRLARTPPPLHALRHTTRARVARRRRGAQIGGFVTPWLHQNQCINQRTSLSKNPSTAMITHKSIKNWFRLFRFQ